MSAREQKVSLTHKTAIKRQLETAISLWVEYGDNASIQTLAGNALQKLHDLGRKPGVNKPSPIMKGIDELDKADRDRVMLPQNFLKHADRRMQHIDSIDYPPEATEHFMYEAVFCYGNLFDELTPSMRLFSAWFTLHNPELFSQVRIPAFEESLRIRGEEITRLGRRKFYDRFYQIVSERLGLGGSLPP